MEHLLYLVQRTNWFGGCSHFERGPAGAGVVAGKFKDGGGRPELSVADNKRNGAEDGFILMNLVG